MKTFKIDDIGAIRINGRLTFLHRITELNKIDSSHYTGIAQGSPFTVEGGKKLGGGRNDWFLDWSALGGKSIYVRGIADAIQLIETA